MNRYIRYLAVAAGLALVTSVAWAQRPGGPSPKLPTQLQAKVVSVNPQQLLVELEGGTVLIAHSAEQLELVRPGLKVNLLYSETDGHKHIVRILAVTE